MNWKTWSGVIILKTKNTLLSRAAEYTIDHYWARRAKIVSTQNLLFSLIRIGTLLGFGTQQQILKIPLAGTRHALRLLAEKKLCLTDLGGLIRNNNPRILLSPNHWQAHIVYQLELICVYNYSHPHN